MAHPKKKKFYLCRSLLEITDGRVFKAEEFVQAVETAFLLVDVGVDVKIECRCHVGVSEDDADRLIVAAALDTSGGKGMPHCVEQ